jgi:glucose-6-phosphate isomerase
MTSVKEKQLMAIPFSKYNATERLKRLAEHPFDLTAPGNLTPERLEKFRAASCGYKLFYGTERITEEVMQALLDLAREGQALKKMEQMQAGEVLNTIHGYPSENRSVLHTATRDFFDNPNPAKAAVEAARLTMSEIDKLKTFISKINCENRFTDLVMIGIGGSDLGPRAHYIALQYLQKKDRRAHFICNVDPDDAANTLHGVDLAKTLVLVISKTGTTLETASNEEIVRARFKQEKLKPEQHFISVTMPGSPMDDPNKYLATFHIWDWIGGRYSTTSMVGGVLLSFTCGFDSFWEFLRGASAMDKAALTSDTSKNLPLLAALLGIWNRNFLNHPTLGIIPYSQALQRFPAHIQQLDMESNGKHIDKFGRTVDFETGPIIWGEPGTNAQHSFYQLIHQGTTVVPLEIIGYKQSQLEQDLNYQGTTSQQKLLANLFAQSLGLATGQKNENPDKEFQGNRPTHILLGERLTPFSLGALLSFFEHKVAFQGFIWDINSFDQEGVQLGKVLANRIIGRYANPQSSEAYPLADVYLRE